MIFSYFKRAENDVYVFDWEWGCYKLIKFHLFVGIDFDKTGREGVKSCIFILNRFGFHHTMR